MPSQRTDNPSPLRNNFSSRTKVEGREKRSKFVDLRLLNLRNLRTNVDKKWRCW